MNVGLAYQAFFQPFQKYFPELQVIGENYKIIPDMDLVIFSGGEDINPEIYGQKNSLSYINLYRDSVETEVFRFCNNSGVKMLGVCRGHQLINALYGGSIVQDIGTKFGKNHPSEHVLFWNHESEFREIFSSVNSMHHQGVTKVADCLIPVAYYEKTYEICTSSRVITVQFHPEFMEDIVADKFFNYIREWVKIPILKNKRSVNTLYQTFRFNP